MGITCQVVGDRVVGNIGYDYIGCRTNGGKQGLVDRLGGSVR